MFIATLGRQPEISFAELEAVFGRQNVQPATHDIATIDADDIDLSILGGTTKIAKVITTHNYANKRDSDLFTDISRQITNHYTDKWRSVDHKITLGISTYGFNIPPRAVQKTGIILKGSLKKSGVSLRLIPNTESALSTAVSHNNKLGLSDNKVELIIVKTKTSVIIAESRGAQNITAYTRRDHGKPKRDAFVGMLPPKLAQIMLNLALETSAISPRPTSPLETPAQTQLARHDEVMDGRGLSEPLVASSGDHQERVMNGDWRAEAVSRGDGGERATATIILDPFCGTGTVLQEALLRQFDVIGTDLSDKMVSYTQENLNWITKSHKHTGQIIEISQADATNNQWSNAQQISAVVCETYLGQPFSAPPSPAKLKEVTGNCNHIISGFLKNIHPQLAHGTRLCIAVPAWRSKDGSLTHLPLTRDPSRLGFDLVRPPMIYSRPDQVVARELLVLVVK